MKIGNNQEHDLGTMVRLLYCHLGVKGSKHEQPLHMQGQGYVQPTILNPAVDRSLMQEATLTIGNNQTQTKEVTMKNCCQ